MFQRTKQRLIQQVVYNIRMESRGVDLYTLLYFKMNIVLSDYKKPYLTIKGKVFCCYYETKVSF